jgi:hypothetical protein
MRRIFFISCIFFVFIISANAGEIFNCIDHDGNSIITDTPKDGMKCNLQNRDNIEFSQEEQTEGESNQKAQPEENMKLKFLSLAADFACLEKYLKNIDEKCRENVRNKIFQKLSPHCRELRNAGQLKELYKDCDNEMESADRQILQEGKKCNKLPANSKCMKKVEAMQMQIQKDEFKCKKKLRKAGICMTGKSIDYDCLAKHGAEIVAICGNYLQNVHMAGSPDRKMP